jgi:hypothetical protein
MQVFWGVWMSLKIIGDVWVHHRHYISGSYIYVADDIGSRTAKTLVSLVGLSYS